MTIQIDKNLLEEVIKTCEESELDEVKENIYSCGYGELQLFKKRIDGELKILAINFLYNSFSFIIDKDGYVGVETDDGTFALEGNNVQTLIEETIRLQLKWINFTRVDNLTEESNGGDDAKSNVLNFLRGKR